MENKFRGVTTALITPFLDNGDVDYEGYRSNLKHQVENGINGLLALGTTGEAPTVSREEQDKIIEITVEIGKTANVPVMVGVGTNNTATSIKNAQRAKELGTDAILVVTPYYNKPTQEGIFQHFTAIHNAANLPLCVYNIKGRTGTNIETPTLKRISELDNVFAVKEASGDINQMMHVLTTIPDLAVISGDDSMTFPLTCLGGQGVISVVSNLFPKQVVEMVDAALQGNVEQARQLHFKLLPLFKGAFVESNPIPIKYAMDQRSLKGGNVRLPLTTISEKNKEVIDALLKNY